MRRMIDRHPWGGLAVPGAPLPPDVTILGLPYDGGASYRSGAAAAPARLREISVTSSAISEEGYVIDPSALRLHDIGDLAPGGEPGAPFTDAQRREYFSRIEQEVQKVFKLAALGGRDTFLLSLGGDHSVSIPLIQAFARGFPEGYGLITLDAHPDLFDTYEGSPLSHACPIRRAIDSSRLKPEHLLILGTRSYNEVELAFMREKGIRFVPARAIDRTGVDEVVARACEQMKGLGNIYLTIDIDVADPGCAPGTGYPVAGGLSSRQLLDLTRGILQRLPVRAMDLVEIAPALDPTNATLFLGLQIIFESLAVLAEKRKPKQRSAGPQFDSSSRM